VYVPLITCDIAEKRKIHFLFSDGTEMCEEYDLKSGLLLGNTMQSRDRIGTGIWTQVHVLHSGTIHTTQFLKALQNFHNKYIVLSTIHTDVVCRR